MTIPSLQEGGRGLYIRIAPMESVHFGIVVTVPYGDKYCYWGRKYQFVPVWSKINLSLAALVWCPLRNYIYVGIHILEIPL